MVGNRLRGTRRAVRAARAELAANGSAAPRASESVRVRLTVEPKLVDDITDLVRRVEGRAVRDEDSVVTVPFPPGRESARAVTELRRVLDRWTDRHPGIRVEVLRSRESNHDFASAAGAKVGRGLAVTAAIARGLGSAASVKRRAQGIRWPAVRLRPRRSADDGSSDGSFRGSDVPPPVEL